MSWRIPVVTDETEGRHAFSESVSTVPWPHPPVRWLASIGCLALAGCVFMPRTTIGYDPVCGVAEKHMSLQMHQVGAFVRCRDQGCVELLAAAGVISAASLVVSGSIVVLGEAVYWLEAKGQCLSKLR